MEALALAGEVAPYIVAAAGTYGTAALTRAGEAGGDAAGEFGRSLLRRLWRREEGRAELEEAVRDVGEAPGDEELGAVLLVRVRKALLADPELAADIAGMLARYSGGGPSVTVTASGEGAVAVQHNSGVISTGNDAQIAP
ncbi:hypothetical protein D7294_11585 [Streptomyces hoynatensis]|uniref:Uncharacterized protein n=1 Tax=Streptomyces hoynatensis TaxID=1141874 RepID=A0A3A9Z7H5_9ACTN|nr:hypothetical protein D7294_11585 [Streptomyces hoynatensis]